MCLAHKCTALFDHQLLLIRLPLVMVCHLPVVRHSGIGDTVFAAIGTFLWPQRGVMNLHVPLHLPRLTRISTYFTDALINLELLFQLFPPSGCMLCQFMVLEAYLTRDPFPTDVTTESILIALWMSHMHVVLQTPLHNFLAADRTVDLLHPDWSLPTSISLVFLVSHNSKIHLPRVFFSPMVLEFLCCRSGFLAKFTLNLELRWIHILVLPQPLQSLLLSFPTVRMILAPVRTPGFCADKFPFAKVALVWFLPSMLGPDMNYQLFSVSVPTLAYLTLPFKIALSVDFHHVLFQAFFYWEKFIALRAIESDVLMYLIDV